MIVVQFLAADQDAPRRYVRAGVGSVVIAIAPVVTDAVDDAGREERDPDHLHRPDRQSSRAEQHQVDDHHQADALPCVFRVDIPLYPVVRGAVTVAGDRFRVLRLGLIQLGAGPQNRLDAARLRAVRILDRLALGVMLAVDRDPIARLHARREPEPGTEEVRHQRMQIERAVRLAAVQVDRDRGDRDVSQRERGEDELPPVELQQPTIQEFKQIHQVIVLGRRRIPGTAALVRR